MSPSVPDKASKDTDPEVPEPVASVGADSVRGVTTTGILAW